MQVVSLMRRYVGVQDDNAMCREINSDIQFVIQSDSEGSSSLC
jgi:hypothetical protein